METLTSSLKASGKNSKEAVGKAVTILVPSDELPVRSVSNSVSAACQGSALLATSQASAGADVKGKLSLNSPTRLQFLHLYVHTLSELAQEKLHAQLYLESFSVELVVLAVWKEVLRVCSSLAAAGIEGGSIESSSAAESSPSVECSCSSLHISEDVDFYNPVSVCSWAEKEFISAFDQAEKISSFVMNMDGGAEMPDAMEIVFRTALDAGTSGAVDELMENRARAASSYSKATILLSFILTEATSLPLNPRFCLSSDDQQRIQRYITNLKARQNQSEMTAQPSPNQTSGDLRIRDMRHEDMTFFLLCCWRVWFLRNKFREEGVQPYFADTFAWCTEFINHYREAKLFTYSEPPERAMVTRWAKPPRGFVKINTDGRCLMDRDGFGCAAVIRDSGGSFIVARGWKWDGVREPLLIEATALLLGIQ